MLDANIVLIDEKGMQRIFSEMLKQGIPYAIVILLISGIVIYFGIPLLQKLFTLISCYKK